jgi:hypothetical protein
MQQRKLPFRDSHRVAADSSERKSMGKHTEQEEEDSIEQDGDPNLRPGEAGSDQPTIDQQAHQHHCGVQETLTWVDELARRRAGWPVRRGHGGLQVTRESGVAGRSVAVPRYVNACNLLHALRWF